MGGGGDLEKPEEGIQALLIICSYKWFFSGKVFVMGWERDLEKAEEEIQALLALHALQSANTPSANG